MAQWTGDYTDEQKHELEYYLRKIKNCKKLQENAESAAEMERLEEEIHILEEGFNVTLNARSIYNDMILKATLAVDEAESWGRKYGFK